MDQRFIEYRVVLRSDANLADVTSAMPGANPDWNRLTTVIDEGAKIVPDRRRRLTRIIETGMGGEQLSMDRAAWEMGRRYGRSQVVVVTVDSWRDSAGRLWEPNWLVDLKIPALGVEPRRMWVIGEVTYRRGLDGTHADLVLMPPEAFQPAPVILQPFDAQVAADLGVNPDLRPNQEAPR